MAIDMYLTLNETRVLGALIEKEITTPDQYPLSLNALANACNQKSNREPVLNLSEAQVQDTVDELIKKRLLTEVSGFGSRVTKLQHRFCNTEFSPLQFSAQELGIINVLLLRGPQTPGELRTRTNRLCNFTDVQDVDVILQQLTERQDGPFVVKLPREPGKRESRYQHLFSGEVTGDEQQAEDSNTALSDNKQQHSNNHKSEQPNTLQLSASTTHAPESPSTDRLAKLEQRVEALEEEVETLKALLNELL